MVHAWGSERTPMRGGTALANVPDEAARRAFNWWVFEGYDDGQVYTSAAGLFPAGGSQSNIGFRRAVNER
jgi:hypothetical protein